MSETISQHTRRKPKESHSTSPCVRIGEGDPRRRYPNNIAILLVQLVPIVDDITGNKLEIVRKVERST